MTTFLEETMKDKLLKEFAEHPAMKFANDAIVLAAVRSGTSGYTGKENLTEWLSRALDCMYTEGFDKACALYQLPPKV